MQQVLIIISAVFLFLREQTAKAPKGLKQAVLGACGMVVFVKAMGEIKRDSLLKDVANDINASLAVQLHDAFNPIDLGWFNNWNGTDEKKVTSIAAQMQTLKNYDAVSDAYLTLYNKNLTDELTNEGVYDSFFAMYKQTIIPPITTSTNSQTFKKGDIVYTKGGYNLRSTDSPYGVNNSSVAGEDWILYNNPYYATIQGIAGWWVVIEQPKSRYNFYPSYFVVTLPAIYKK